MTALRLVHDLSWVAVFSFVFGLGPLSISVCESSLQLSPPVLFFFFLILYYFILFFRYSAFNGFGNSSYRRSRCKRSQPSFRKTVLFCLHYGEFSYRIQRPSACGFRFRCRSQRQNKVYTFFFLSKIFYPDRIYHILKTFPENMDLGEFYNDMKY